MKYARKAQYASEFRLVDVVRILPQHQVDPLAWLAKQFPGYTGWFELMQDVGNGAVEQPDGSFVQPPIPDPQPRDLPLSKTAFMDVCQTAFGGNSTGCQRFGAIIRACGASADDEVRFVYERFQGAQSFDKAVVRQLMVLLVSKGAALIVPPVTNAEKDAVMAAWPTGL